MEWVKYSERLPAIGEEFRARLHIPGTKPEVIAVRMEEWDSIKNKPWFRAGTLFFGLESSDDWMPLPPKSKEPERYELPEDFQRFADSNPWMPPKPTDGGEG